MESTLNPEALRLRGELEKSLSLNEKLTAKSKGFPIH